MRKRMIAKFVGKDANTGFPIGVGDEIVYDTETRKAYLDDREHKDDDLNGVTLKDEYEQQR